MASYLLLDGHSLAYRAWFALQEAGMKTSSGQETQAVYGFVGMMTRLLTDFSPDGMAVAFDRAEPTFRDSLVSDYKAGRAPMPDPLRQQIELIRAFVAALGIPAVDAAGYEADDVIATLATRLQANGDDVVIVTGDRDAYQLVSDPRIRVLYNRRGVTDYVMYDEAGIAERTGVKPSDYPLLAALRGDSSDNIVGVPGVGEKTAARLVNEYHDADGIFSNLEKMTPKFRASLAEHEARVRQNLLLTPVVCDVPLEVELSALALGNDDREELGRLLDFLEMRAPRDRLFAVLDAVGQPGAPELSEQIPDARPIVVFDEVNAAAKFLETAKQLTDEHGRIVLEPSWAGLPGRSAIAALAVLVGTNDEATTTLGVITGEVIGEEALLAPLRELLDGIGHDHRPRIVAQRSKELMRALAPLGIDVTGLETDTAVVAYLVDPSSGQTSLDEVALRLGFTAPTTSPTEAGQLGFDLAGPGGDIYEATARRAELIDAIAARLRAELEFAAETELYEEIERPLVRVLAKMEVAGVGVDADRLREIGAELTSEARRLEIEIQEIAGEPFNVNSTAQLRVVLYDKLGLVPQRKTKTGYSTDAATLERLAALPDAHPIITMLLRYREVEKLRSTYGEGLLGEVAPDGRIHASFNQTVARTGRLSSDQPNLHNIPVRTAEGRRFREAFVPAEGAQLLVADYNQIELRVIAHLSGDPGLVGAFSEGRDIHATTAARLFGVEAEEVNNAQRSKAKMVSYGLAYGMEAYGLSQRLRIGVDEAAGILEQYFTAFPAVRAYMDQTVAEARARGYTETERGRRRHLPELGSSNFRIRQAAERQAMNAGIQGLAADIFKIALVRLDEALEASALGSRIVLQVHDEVLVEAPIAEHEVAEAITLDAMRNAYPLKVPLEVHCEWGQSWAAAKHA